MNILEKILEEIEEYEKKKCSGESLSAFESGINRGCLEAKNIIRSHMDDMNGRRLIDANALDEEIMSFFLTITGSPKQATVVRECKESFRRMIDEQPTIYACDSWIPVSKRLPEDGETVLCTDGEDIFLVEYEASLDVGFGDMDWIIAWQPLPEPYVRRRK